MAKGTKTQERQPLLNNPTISEETSVALAESLPLTGGRNEPICRVPPSGNTTDETRFDKHDVYIVIMISLLFVGMLTATGMAEIDVQYLFICRSMGVQSDQCMSSDEVAKQVIWVASTASLIGGTIELFAISSWSSLSDRYGRRPMLIGNLACALVSQLCSYFVVFKSTTALPAYMLVIPGLMWNCAGGFRLLATILIAYITDCVEDAALRSRILSINDGLVYVCIALFPSIGSWYIGKWGIRSLIELTLAGSVVVVILSFFLVRESLSGTVRKSNQAERIDWRRAWDLLTFRNIQEKSSRRNAQIYMICSAVEGDLVSAFANILILFPRARFHWTARESGYMLTILSVTRATMLIIGFPRLYKYFSTKWTIDQNAIDFIDKSLLQVCLICMAAGFYIMGYATSGSGYLIGAVFDGLSSLGMPITAPALLKHTDKAQIGTFLAAKASVNSIVLIVLPSLFLQLYQWSYDFRKNLSFEVVATLFLSLLVLSSFLKTRAPTPVPV